MFASNLVEAASSHVLRGISNVITDHVMSKRGEPQDPQMPRVPWWGFAIAMCTMIFGLLFIMAIQYTIGDLVGTLTMIETPAATVTVSRTSEFEPSQKDGDKDGLLETSLPSMSVVPIKPITSGIRSTVRHITSVGGRWARWRGIAPALCYGIFVHAVYGVLNGLLPHVIPLREMLISMLSAVIFTRVHMAWTHAMISMPSSQRWYKRLVPFKTSVKHLWVPTIVNVCAAYVVVYFIYGFGLLFAFANAAHMNQLPQGSPMPGYMWLVFVLEFIALAAITIGLSLFVILPAAVTLARIEASMLPEEQETIVPFDRSFDGKVVPSVLGGSGCIGFIDAWKTFNWEARKRLIKLYVKNFLILCALFFVLSNLISFEMWAFLGSDGIRKGLRAMKKPY
jgi:hypothetical protein